MTIDQIIKDGRELEYIDKLKSYNLSFDDSALKSGVESLLYLCEKGSYKVDAQQFLKEILLKTLYNDTNLSNTKALLEFIVEHAVKDYVYVSDIIYRIIVDIYDKKISEIKDGENVVVSVDNIEKFKDELISSNYLLLKKAIKDAVTYSSLISVFYANICQLESNRQVIISDEALSLFRDYLQNNPLEYVLNFIRPYYSGTINNSWADYFLHVPEPFFLQIFNDDFTFKHFLEIAKNNGVNNDCIEDLTSFYEMALTKSDKDGARIVYVNNSLYPFNPKGVTLHSKAHNKVRFE